MDFKALNEEVKALLEGGFAVSGKAGEVTDLINKLAQEYGDLTIPEFIDVLINKEKQDENILDESLNEGYRFKNSEVNYKDYTESTKWDIKDINSKYKNITVDVSDKYSGGIGIKIKTKYPKEESQVFFIELLFQQKSETTNEWLGITEIQIYDNDRWGSQHIEKFLKTNTKVLGGVEWSSSTTYDCCFGRTLSRRTKDSNTEAKNELIRELNKLIQKLDDSLKTTSSKYDKELVELEKAKTQAKSNKVAVTTTVGKALSKSAVAKKIRELQNPTPEQLAKILAAIEG